MRYLIFVLLLFIPGIAFGMIVPGKAPESLIREKDEASQKHFLGPVMWALKNREYQKFKEFIKQGHEFPGDQLVGLLALDGTTVATQIPTLFTRCPIKKDSTQTYSTRTSTPAPLKELACHFLFKHDPNIVFTVEKLPNELRDYFIQVLPSCHDQFEYKSLGQVMKNHIDQHPIQVHHAGLRMMEQYSIPRGIVLLQRMASALTKHEKNQVFDALRNDKIQLNGYQQLLYAMTHLVVDKQTELAEQYKKELEAINVGAFGIFNMHMNREMFTLCFRATDELQILEDIVSGTPKQYRFHCLEGIIEELQK